jgi:hypothetical protein
MQQDILSREKIRKIFTVTEAQSCGVCALNVEAYRRGVGRVSAEKE